MVGPSPWQSITAKLLAPILVLGLLLAGLIGFIFVDQYRDFEARSTETAGREVAAAAASLHDKEDQAVNIAKLVALLPDVGDALDARHQRPLVDAVTPFVAHTDLNMLTIYDNAGIIMARGDQPAVFGKTDALSSWLRNRAIAAPTAAMVRIGDRLMMVGVAPIPTVNHPLGGWVVAGFAIDSRFLDGLHARSGAHFLVRDDDRIIATSVNTPSGRMPPRQFKVPLGERLDDGRFMVNVLYDDSSERRQFIARLNLVMVILVVIALTVLAGSVWIILNRVTVPLESITRAMMTLAAGDREVRIPGGERPDEIGAMARAAEVFKGAMTETLALTETNQRERAEKERALAEAAAQAAANQEIQAIITASPVALLLCGGDPPVIDLANQAAVDLLGDGLPEDGRSPLAGLPLQTIVADPADFTYLRLAFGNDGRINRLDAHLRAADGRTVWGAISARVVNRRDRSLLMLGIEDVTQRKAAEKALRDAKDQAETALAELKRTQESLIQAEKMASLSLLVAGVAHEINTPLGVCLTAASFLADETVKVDRILTDGQLRRRDLEIYFTNLRQTMPLMLTNMHRAADLIQSFKQVAVDQTSAERRNFDLATYIDEVLMSVGPHLKRARLTATVHCPEGIDIDGYPGALAQILSNLAINSCLHGYENRDGGALQITVTVDDDMVTLVYADDGNGIPPQNLPRIFEPFFTTRRGSGGTGLGLQIVFNLATKTLRGDISVASEVGRGTTFTLHFPRHPPVA